jgi:hypothetical protein
MCTLTYASHVKHLIQCVLPEGETLGQHTGPGVFWVHVNGDDPAYVEAVKNELEILDPLDTPAAGEARQAAAAKAAEEATASREEASARPGS